MSEEMQDIKVDLESKALVEKSGQAPKILPLDSPVLEEVKGDVETPAQKMMKGAKEIKTLSLPKQDNESSNTITVFMNSNARRTKALQEVSKATEPRINIDLSTANEISPNVVYQIGGMVANTQLLTKVSTQGIPKLTSVVQFDAAVVVETLVFTVDASNNVTTIVDSVNMLNNMDIVSFLPSGGVYYVLYMVYAGGGNAAVYLPSSSSYSANEPNDSPFQAPLRHEEGYLEDTFDNSFDVDVFRLQITKPEPVSISLTFEDKNATGQANIGVYRKSDENGNAVDQWILNGTINVPAVGVTWNNGSLKGEFYIYVQYISGSILNKPYIFSFTPSSKMQVPDWITTAKDHGMTGNEYGTVNVKGGGYVHWVMGAFKVIADFSQYSSHLVMTETGEYPRIPFMIQLIGQDDHGEADTKNNSTSSNFVQSNRFGLATVTALLPGSWGNDDYLPDSSYRYDVNLCEFYFLAYNSATNKFGIVTYPQEKVYVTFYQFLNVAR